MVTWRWISSGPRARFWATASYRAPIKGLYMCGAGTHPGGGVSGSPGRNAAREILRDRSLLTAIGLALRGR